MDKYMQIAIKEAKKSLKTNDVPVGAIIVENNKILAKSHNTREKKHMITRHAEINVIEKACKKKKTWHLTDCTLYVTLEPCPMCLEVIKQARIKKVIYSTPQTKHSNLKTPELECKIKQEATNLIQNFFKEKRK